MKAAERAAWVEYILKQEFAGHGWSKWLLTHSSPGAPASEVAQTQRAQNGVEAEIASRCIVLEALSDDALERAYLRARVRELEANSELGSAKAKELEHGNADLRAHVCELEADAEVCSAKANKLGDENAKLRAAFEDLNADAHPDPRVKTSLLKIVGALINGYNSLVDSYNATEGPSNHAASRKRKLDTTDLKTTVKAIRGMADDMPEARTVRTHVESAISTTSPQRPPAKPAKP